MLCSVLCVSAPTALPPEVLMYIFRWVVSSDLDMRTLEQLSLVCRGFYICARSAPAPQTCAVAFLHPSLCLRPRLYEGACG